MIGISADELLTFVLVALCIVLLLLPALILLVHQEDENRQRLMDEEEAEREAVNAILQAYLDGVEFGLSISKASENNPPEIEHNGKKEKDGE